MLSKKYNAMMMLMFLMGLKVGAALFEVQHEQDATAAIMRGEMKCCKGRQVRISYERKGVVRNDQRPTTNECSNVQTAATRSYL